MRLGPGIEPRPEGTTPWETINLTPNGKPLPRNMNTRRNKRREHQARHHREEVEGLLRDELNVVAYTGAAVQSRSAAVDSYAGTCACATVVYGSPPSPR